MLQILHTYYDPDVGYGRDDRISLCRRRYVDCCQRIIVDVYTKIVGISTVLAGLMSAVAVIGAKISNNQHKTDQAWDWLKRIWVAWAIINGIGAFIAYVAPLFSGLATLTP